VNASSNITIIAPTTLVGVLQELPAQWTIDTIFSNTDQYWDAVDSGDISGKSDIVLMWSGCDGGSTDVSGSAISIAPYSQVWIFTAEGQVDQTKRDIRVYETELNMPGTAQSIQVVAMSPDEVETTIRRELRDVVVFPERSAPTPVSPQRPLLSQRPTLAVIEPSLQEMSAAADGKENYAQARIYGAEVARGAHTDFDKLPNAIPGQSTIACMSSKGGSGKSTTALSLAATIAQASKKAGAPKKVVVVDLDVRDGQVGSLIGQYLPTAVSIRVQPQWDAKTITENLVHDARLGIDALLAPVRPRNAEDVGPDFYRQVIQGLQTTHDVVILDCSVSYLDPLLGMAFSMSDAILFVTTLTTTSIQGMARALGEMFAPVEEGGLGIEPEMVGIVANQVMPNVGINKDQIFSAALGSQIVGMIPAAFTEVIVATNSLRLDKLLIHPQLGPAYFRLAKRCLPKIAMEPLI
jgi:Mrp family chromosome partitioning ATPase